MCTYCYRVNCTQGCFDLAVIIKDKSASRNTPTLKYSIRFILKWNQLIKLGVAPEEERAEYVPTSTGNTFVLNMSYFQ